MLNQNPSPNLNELRARVAAVATFLDHPTEDVQILDLLRAVQQEFNRRKELGQFGVAELEKQAYAAFDAEARPFDGWGAARKVAGAGLLIAGGTVVAPALLVGALNIIGFSAIGPVAGSLAAAIQSTFYGGAVGAGSAFALAQAAAMGGIVVEGAVGLAAGTAAVAGGVGLMAAGGDENEDDE